MRSDFIAPSLGFSVHAYAADPPPFGRYIGILGCELVASFAMGLCSALCPSLLNYVALDWRMKLNRRHDLFQREAPLKSILNGPRGNSYLLGYLCRPNYGAIDIDHKRPMSGFLLLLPRRPFEVIRGVWPVIVNTINGMVRSRLLANIGNEKPEVVPSITDSYTSASVPMEMGGIWLVATRKHVAPSVIEWVSFLDHSTTLERNTTIVKEAC